MGQTIRSLSKRFYEHCSDSRNDSVIHHAINKYGQENFTIELLQENIATQEELNEQEKYFIQFYDTYKNGYNATKGGDNCLYSYRNVRVIENNLIIDSVEYLGRLFEQENIFQLRTIASKIRDTIAQHKNFYSFHLEYCTAYDNEISDEKDILNWIRSLSIQYSCQGIYCPELDYTAYSIGEMAEYLLTNHYYIGNSKLNPKQTITVLIKNIITTNQTTSLLNNFHFIITNIKQKQYRNTTSSWKKQKFIVQK